MDLTPIRDELNNAVALLTVLSESLTTDFPRYYQTELIKTKVEQVVEAMRHGAE